MDPLQLLLGNPKKQRKQTRTKPKEPVRAGKSTCPAKRRTPKAPKRACAIPGRSNRSDTCTKAVIEETSESPATPVMVCKLPESEITEEEDEVPSFSVPSTEVLTLSQVSPRGRMKDYTSTGYEGMPAVIDDDVPVAPLPAIKKTPTGNTLKIDNMVKERGQNVEEQLIRYGYTPIAKISVEGKVKYVKALNPVGITVYVDLDQDGYITKNSNDISVVQSIDSKVIPYSYKTGVYNSSYPESVGAMIECNEGVCAIINGPNGVGSGEDNFYNYTQPRSQAISEQGNSMVTRVTGMDHYTDNNYASSPIIRLSSIKLDPVSVLTNTEVTYNRLLVNTLTACIEDLKVFDDSIKTIQPVGIEMTSKILKFDSDLGAANTNNTNVTRALAIKFFQQGQLYDNDKIIYETHLKNARIMTEMKTDLVKACRLAREKSKELNSIINDIRSATGYLDRRFK